MPLHPVWHRLHACGHQKLFHKTPSSAANIAYKRKTVSEVTYQKRQEAVFLLRSRGEEEVAGKNKAQPSFFLQTDFEDVWELAWVAGAWMYWVKERTGTRKGTHVFSCAHYFQAPGNQMRPCVESIRSQYPRGSNFHLHKSRLFYLSNLLLVWFWPKYWSSIPPPPVFVSHPPEREAKIYLTWHYTCTMCYKTLRVIRMKFLIIMEEDQSDISKNSPNCFYWKIIGTVNENLNFDIRVYLDTDCRVV